MGLSRKLTRAGIWRDEGGGSCGDLWPEEDVVSEVVEAPDQIARGSRPRLLIKEGLSKFLEGNGFGEHVEHGDQDLVRDGHGGPQRTPARLQPVVLVLVVAALGPGGADRGLNESRLEVGVTLAGSRVLLLSGALVMVLLQGLQRLADRVEGADWRPQEGIDAPKGQGSD